MVEQRGRLLTSALRIRRPAKTQVLAFSTVAAIEQNQGFLHLSHSLPSRMRDVLLFLATYWPLGILNS